MHRRLVVAGFSPPPPRRAEARHYQASMHSALGELSGLIQPVGARRVFGPVSQSGLGVIDRPEAVGVIGDAVVDSEVDLLGPQAGIDQPRQVRVAEPGGGVAAQAL